MRCGSLQPHFYFFAFTLELLLPAPTGSVRRNPSNCLSCGDCPFNRIERRSPTVPTLPMMKEVPVADFHPVPTDYRDRDALGIADQMTQISLNATQTVTLLLLDPQRLLNLVR